MTYTFTGADQGGVTRTGVADTEDTPLDVVRRFYPRGWRWLVVYDEAGHAVGSIGKRKGRRSWWAWQTTDPGVEA